MKKIRVIVKHPGERVGHIMTIKNELKEFQKAVDGNIEAVYKPTFIIICNETGKIDRLPYNFQMPGDCIMGTVLVVGADGEDFDDCPISLDDWAEWLASWGNEEVKEWQKL